MLCKDIINLFKDIKDRQSLKSKVKYSDSSNFEITKGNSNNNRKDKMPDDESIRKFIRDRLNNNNCDPNSQTKTVIITYENEQDSTNPNRLAALGRQSIVKVYPMLTNEFDQLNRQLKNKILNRNTNFYDLAKEVVSHVGETPWFPSEQDLKKSNGAKNLIVNVVEQNLTESVLNMLKENIKSDKETIRWDQKAAKKRFGSNAVNYIHSKADNNGGTIEQECFTITKKEQQFITEYTHLYDKISNARELFTDKKLLEKLRSNAQNIFNIINSLSEKINSVKSYLNISDRFDVYVYFASIGYPLQNFYKYQNDAGYDSYDNTVDLDAYLNNPARQDKTKDLIYGLKPLLQSTINLVNDVFNGISRVEANDKFLKLKSLLTRYQNTRKNAILYKLNDRTEFSFKNLISRVARVNNFACTGKWYCPECGADMNGSYCPDCGYSC